MMAAAAAGHADCLKELLPWADPQEADAEGRTALIHAAAHARVECVEILAPIGAAKATSQRGDSALSLLAGVAIPSPLLRDLLSLSDPLSANAQGETALIAAAAAGLLDAVEILAPACDADAQTQEGHTALMKAVKGARLDIARCLLPFSSPDAQDKQGRTALMWAVEEGDEEMAKMLIPRSNARAQDLEGRSAFTLALAKNKPELVDALAHGASPDELAVALARWGGLALPHARAIEDARELLSEVAASDELAVREKNSEPPRSRRAPRAL